jgi:hypothetical protein
MKFQDVLAGIGMLIMLYLLLANWKGANALLTTAAGASISMTRTLQGR